MNQKAVPFTITPEHIEAAAQKGFELAISKPQASPEEVMNRCLEDLRTSMRENNPNMIAVRKAVCKKVFDYQKLDGQLDPHASMKGRDLER